MNQIGEFLEENLKEQLKYKHKPVSHQRKLFNNLILMCIAYGIEYKCKGFYLEGIKIHLHKSGEPVGAYWCKPIVRHGRLYLSFKKPKRIMIDASHVEEFGESIQHP